MELHQSQLRLIREQTAIFIRDLAALQGEAGGGVVEAHGGHSCISENLFAGEVAALKEGLTSNGTPLTPLQNDFKEQKAGSSSSKMTLLNVRCEYALGICLKLPKAKLLAQEQLTVSIQKRANLN